MSNLLYSLKSITRYNSNTKIANANIGYGIDNNYARCTAASIVSICLNNPQYVIDFHIITNNLSVDNKRRFQKLSEKYFINIYIYEINISYLKSLPVLNHYSIAIYFRLLLPLILIKIKQIIYLDADIVCINSINELIELDLKNYIIAAVPDVEWTSEQKIQKLKLKNHKYFNSGLLIINIDNWNKDMVSEKIISVLNNPENKLEHPDQDALNIILNKKVIYLEKKYNRINMDSMDINNDCLLHFAAKSKPWHLSWLVSPTCNEFNKNIYSYYEKKTSWKEMPVEKPKTYKQMHFYAKCLKKHHQYLKSIKWYFRYIFAKIIFFKNIRR